MLENPGLDGTTEVLRAGADGAGDLAVAARYRPLLCLDGREPYRPLAAGVTLFREAGNSPSTGFRVVPRGAITIEYAIWYDWDIQHLYELEHVWVHVGADGAVVAVEASAHGGRFDMRRDGALPEMRGDRPVLYAEPGKHAHWADPKAMQAEVGQRLTQTCHSLAGHDGVLVATPFGERGEILATPLDHRLARLKMIADAFVPSFSFVPNPDDEAMVLVEWGLLAGWIPARVRRVADGLLDTVPHLKAVFLDSGDTLVDEGTEKRHPGTEVVHEAQLIDGAGEVLAALKARGYPMVLVADGPRGTFENVHKAHAIWDFFDGHVISGDIGVEKPHPEMFDAGLKVLGLGEADRPFVVMVGNNLTRDIAGANAAGLRSVFYAWSPRRSHIPGHDGERPDYTITALDQLPGLLDRIEQLLAFTDPTERRAAE